jgi:hypothetical protein
MPLSDDICKIKSAATSGAFVNIYVICFYRGMQGLAAPTCQISLYPQE